VRKAILDPQGFKVQ